MKRLCGLTPSNKIQQSPVRFNQEISLMTKFLRLGSIGVVFGACLLSTAALAAEWYPVVAGSNVAIFVDKSSIKTSGKQKTFMQWQLFGQRIGVADSAKTRTVFDCSNKTRKTEYLIAISEIDTVKSEGKVDDTFKPVVENSLEASVFQAVCQNKFDGKPQSTVNINDVRNYLYFNQGR